MIWLLIGKAKFISGGMFRFTTFSFPFHAYYIRLRDLRAEPHSQKQAEAAIGLSTDNGQNHTAEGTESDIQLP